MKPSYGSCLSAPRIGPTPRHTPCSRCSTSSPRATPLARTTPSTSRAPSRTRSTSAATCGSPAGMPAGCSRLAAPRAPPLRGVRAAAAAEPLLSQNMRRCVPLRRSRARRSPAGGDAGEAALALAAERSCMCVRAPACVLCSMCRESNLAGTTLGSGYTMSADGNPVGRGGRRAAAVRCALLRPHVPAVLQCACSNPRCFDAPR